MTKKSKDFYATLGVNRNANDSEIKKAYKKMALKHHPDKNPGNPKAQAMFQACAEAYEVLSNPEKRKIYDQFGEDGLQAGFNPNAGASSGGMNAAGGMGGAGGMGFNGMPGGVRMSRMGGDGGVHTFHFTSSAGAGAGGGVDPFEMFSHVFGDFGGAGDDFASFTRRPSGATFHRVGGHGNLQQQQQGFSRMSGFPSTSFHEQGFPTSFNGYSEPQEQQQRPQQRRVPKKTSNPSVVITSVTSDPSLNGKPGKIVGYDRSSHRYQVVIGSGRIIALKPENVLLHPTTLVRIHGLKSSSQYNNEQAEIVDFDPETERYTVELSGGHRLSVKSSNIHVTC